MGVESGRSCCGGRGGQSARPDQNSDWRRKSDSRRQTAREDWQLRFPWLRRIDERPGEGFRESAGGCDEHSIDRTDNAVVSQTTDTDPGRSEEHTSELQSRFGISYAV